MKKILSLDLGISSLGYSVLEEQERNSYICLDNSVIMRDAPYDKDGKSRQTSRSEQAGQRALIEKRRRRIKNLARIFEKFGILTYKECMDIQKKNPIKDKWRLRAEVALSEALKPEELFAVLSHMAKHRGYKSIATEDLLYELELELGLIEESVDDDSSADEKRRVYAALGRVERLKSRYKTDTIAQVIHKAVQEGEFRSYRNHDDYEKMIRREDIEHEIEVIVGKQYDLGALKLGSEECGEFVEALQETITDQVMPENDASLFGNCSYYPDEKAAPRYSYLYDIYRLYKVLADLKIDHYDVTQEDREKIVGYLTDKVAKGKNIKQFNYKEVRKILSLSEDQKLFGKEDQMIIKGKATERSLVKFFFLSEIARFPTLMKSILSQNSVLMIFAELAELLRLHKTPKPALEAIEALLLQNDLWAPLKIPSANKSSNQKVEY